MVNKEWLKIAPLVQFLLKFKKKINPIMIAVLVMASLLFAGILLWIGRAILGKYMTPPTPIPIPAPTLSIPPQAVVPPVLTGAVVAPPPPTSTGSDDIEYKKLQVDMQMSEYIQSKKDEIVGLDVSRLAKEKEISTTDLTICQSSLDTCLTSSDTLSEQNKKYEGMKEDLDQAQADLASKVEELGTTQESLQAERQKNKTIIGALRTLCVSAHTGAVADFCHSEIK